MAGGVHKITSIEDQIQQWNSKDEVHTCVSRRWVRTGRLCGWTEGFMAATQDQVVLEAFQWVLRRILIISWEEKITNAEVLRRMKKKLYLSLNYGTAFYSYYKRR